ncbi:hypothetical protein SPI_00864 [Niveomyces insectorum RCEF 264]|uniref:Uncharacterized protein n=1 Tax=Niveomyces insectorum RCEF 264 TaxID=1081102 RepID=A0A162MQV0_9HYPO|nr:hypothetical protein SPI_00864 [Niveomyces insectorum RCEF 264]
MPSQILAPVPVTPVRKGLKVVTSADLFANLSATLATTTPTYSSVDARIRTLPEHDYTVPAPPPPSPVGFRKEH